MSENAAPAPPELEVVTRGELPPRTKAPGAEVVPIRKGVATTAETSISLSPGQVWWTDRQLQAIRNKYPQDEQPSDADLMTFLHLCLSTGLDPFRNEIYYIGRKDDRAPNGRRFTAQTGIDGYRHIAERTGEFAGRLMTQWCGEDGEWVDVWLKPTPPAAARVAIARRGLDHPFYGVATYAEFVPLQEVWEGGRGNRKRVYNEDGSVKTKPMGLWSKMPSHMLAKCAEAQALRSAFPRQLSGLYVEEEMDQASAADAAARADARTGQRSALSDRPWARNPVEGDAVQIVDGEIVLPPREALLEELANQAKIMDRTLQQWVVRWVASRKKNIEEATDRELWDLAESRRDMVSTKADEIGVVPFVASAAAQEPDAPAEAGSDDQEPAEAPTAEGPDIAQDGNDGTAAVAEPAPASRGRRVPEGVIEGEPVVDVGQPQSASELHAFEPGDGDEPQFCGFMGCQLTEDDPVHRRVERTGQEPLL